MNVFSFYLVLACAATHQFCTFFPLGAVDTWSCQRWLFFSWSSHKTPAPAAQSLLLLGSWRLAACLGRHIQDPFGWRFSLLRGFVFFTFWVVLVLLLGTTPWTMSSRIGHGVPGETKPVSASVITCSIHSYFSKGGFSDMLEAHFALITHPPILLFSTFSFPTFFFLFLYSGDSFWVIISSTSMVLVWPCNCCLGSRLLSAQELPLKCHLAELG